MTVQITRIEDLADANLRVGYDAVGTPVILLDERGNAFPLPFVRTDPVTGEIESLGNGGIPSITTIANQPHYKLATFGDSRSNTAGIHTGSMVSGSLLNTSRVPVVLCQVRPDIKLVFNGGVSGDSCSLWEAARGTSQSVEDVLAASPDAVFIQYGINDIIGWNGSSPTRSNMILQTSNYLKSACAAFMGSGVFVIFESINPCAQGSASYINGYSSAGGFGANYADKLDVLQQVNSQMQSWLANWRDRAIYVDTSPVFAAADGYAKTNGTYYDGTHGSSYGALPAAQLVDSAIRYKMPLRTAILPGTNRNAVTGFWTNPTSGLGENVAFTADTGTWATETYSIDGDEQIINFNCTALSSGVARRIVDITPLIIGAGAIVPVNAADVMQGRIEYTLDDGAGGRPNVFAISLRQRIYYDDASNEFVAFGQPTQTGSTDHPRMPAHSGALLTPGLAIKAAKASANITASTRLQILIYGNTTGPTRLRLRNGEFRKVA